jgi:hypothetical protein
MWNLDPKTLIALFAIIQTAGMGSAYLARSGAASRVPQFYYSAFYALLALAGVANVVSLAVNSSLWLISSVVLAMMVLTATLDVGSSRATVS